MLTQIDRIRGGKAPRYVLRWTMQDLSKATGKSLNAMRHDRHKGIYNPHDILSLALYIERCQLKAARPRKTRKRKAKPTVPPKAPESTT